MSQYQGWDALSGRLWPELGGAPGYLDIIGVNFYPRNEWIHEVGPMHPGEPLYRPLSQILSEVYERYRRPMFIGETGTEDEKRPSWFRYVCDQVAVARGKGVPVEAVCLYPIVNHPGWEDDRHCCNGLWDYPGPDGEREIYAPLADELDAQRQRFEKHDGVDENLSAGLATPPVG